MTHEEMKELYELYLLGVLDADATAEIDSHLSTNCEQCLAGIREASLVTSGMVGLAGVEKPPAHLRERVLASVTPAKPKRNWIWAVAALSAACAALLVFTISSANSLRTYRAQVESLSAQRNQLREAVEILSKSETRTVQFGKAENVPHGRVFVNRNSGIVFVGSQLPQLASGRTFQLWLIPSTGSPQSAGVFRANAAGDFVNVRTTPIDTNRIGAVAVSVEPDGGSPAPTTTPILVVPLA
jgi:anti-sigma-K factor RskA